MQVLAPAKINLSLKVRHLRADGYHEIETFMAPISLADELNIDRIQTGGIEFQCDDPALPAGGANLVVRAAELFFGALETLPAVRIHLRKQIPHGAGLGGGSSDAATTLVTLNQMFGNKISQPNLVELAGKLGADVPFFLQASAAVCRGRGEIVSPMPLKQRLSILLLKPEFPVPTGWAYSRWADSAELPGINYAAHEFAGHPFVNDLERPVFEKYVFLAEMKMWLLRQPEVALALMSGSGSTVFAVLRDARNADPISRRARAELDPKLWTFACETL